MRVAACARPGGAAVPRPAAVPGLTAGDGWEPAAGRRGAGRAATAPMGVSGLLGHTMCFLRQGQQLLLLNRRRQPAMGLWTGVGGKIEPGETPLQGALREVHEETAIQVEGARFAGVVSWGHGGMYAFVVDLPPDFVYAAPRDTDEGVLAWQDLGWILDADNYGVARHVRQALPALLAGERCEEHCFTFASGAGSTDWTILEYATAPLRPEALARTRR